MQAINGGVGSELSHATVAAGRDTRTGGAKCLCAPPPVGTGGKSAAAQRQPHFLQGSPHPCHLPNDHLPPTHPHFQMGRPMLAEQATSQHAARRAHHSCLCQACCPPGSQPEECAGVEHCLLAGQSPALVLLLTGRDQHECRHQFSIGCSSPAGAGARRLAPLELSPRAHTRPSQPTPGTPACCRAEVTPAWPSGGWAQTARGA